MIRFLPLLQNEKQKWVNKSKSQKAQPSNKSGRDRVEEISLIIFYKVEEKGESIQATMNDINRKCWVIKNKEARLWKIIERYELRKVTNIEKD